MSPKGDVSPPMLKRKIDSTTTSKAVASFFKPASQKEPDRITWRVIKNSLVVGRYNCTAVSADKNNNNIPDTNNKTKIAAFDLDDTLIKPIGTNKWARNATSWKWWDTSVPGRLKLLHEEGYIVTIFTNQGLISLKDTPGKNLPKDSLSLGNFKKQISSVLEQLDLPITIYAATEQDLYRKPRTGMWWQMLEDHDLHQGTNLDTWTSFYCGDAAGRPKTDQRHKDHASSDRDLATNIGIPFKTPEDFFLGGEPEPFVSPFDPVRYLQEREAEKLDTTQITTFTKRNKQDIVICCGSPGAGKSTFYWKVLQPLGYERVNQDILKTRDKCIRVARDMLAAGSSVAVDNTNADVEVRSHWVKLAKEFHIPIRCVRFTASIRLCEHNDSVRGLNPDTMNPEKRALLPAVAFRSFVQRFVEPKLDEGFQDITKIDFEFMGTPEEREIWSKLWVSKYST